MQSQNFNTVALAITGASGIPYARRLLQMLIQTNTQVWLMYSKAAQTVAMQECNWILPTKAADATAQIGNEFSASPQQLRVFAKEDWFAPCASGSNPPDAMIVCPASMNTVAKMAHGIADNLIERTASVCLKEKKPLLIVPREMPLSSIHLRNLLTLSENGTHIIPPMPAFYNHPQHIDDIIDFIVSRILDHLKIKHNLGKRWAEKTK